jgi:hypothetical protein
MEEPPPLIVPVPVEPPLFDSFPLEPLLLDLMPLEPLLEPPLLDPLLLFPPVFVPLLFAPLPLDSAPLAPLLLETPPLVPPPLDSPPLVPLLVAPPLLTPAPLLLLAPELPELAELTPPFVTEATTTIAIDADVDVRYGEASLKVAVSWWVPTVVGWNAKVAFAPASDPAVAVTALAPSDWAPSKKVTVSPVIAGPSRLVVTFAVSWSDPPRVSVGCAALSWVVVWVGQLFQSGWKLTEPMPVTRS